MANAAAAVEFVPVGIHTRDGRRVTLHAVRVDDKDRLQAALRGLSVESRYARFMSPLHEFFAQMLERATNPDADRELQLVAVAGDGAQEKLVAGARYTAVAGSKDCEFAIVLTDEWQGQGLARPLLETLMQAARARGFERTEGYILASNARMRGLAKRLGFAQIDSPEGPTVCLVRCDLAGVS
jgi:RimJ/RimL family protein N-acetyltransferase